MLFAQGLADAHWVHAVDDFLAGNLRRWIPSYKSPGHGLLSQELVTEIGIAFVVASLLGATFEIFMRRREEKEHNRRIHDIETAALSSLLGYFVPPTISQEVRDVFDERIMRSNLIVTFTFHIAPDDVEPLPGCTFDAKDLLLVVVTVDYDLVNLTRKPLMHEIDHGFEPTLSLKDIHNHFVSLDVTQAQKPVLSWQYGQPFGKIRFEKGKRYLQSLKYTSILLEAGKEGEIPPKPENAVHVRVKHQLVRRRTDQDSWTTWLPANGLTVKTEITDETALPLEFHLEKTHPRDFERTRVGPNWQWELKNYELTDHNGQKHTVSPGVLPFQGFTLYWFPRDLSVAAQVASVSPQVR